MTYKFTSKHLTLDDRMTSTQVHITFKWLYLINGTTSYDHIWHETHKSYTCMCSFSLPHDIWPWVSLKGQIKVIEAPMGCAL